MLNEKNYTFECEKSICEWFAIIIALISVLKVWVMDSLLMIKQDT